ncbi:MAG: DUF3037 domain-containing protein [Myxococcota bacterium]
MPARPYEYAIVRFVPDVERGEAINVGVIVSCPQADHLACRLEVDRARLGSFAADACLDTLERHLQGLRWVCAGDPQGGPVAALPLRERFHWMVHPRSAALQTSAVHGGLTDDLDAVLPALYRRLVAT